MPRAGRGVQLRSIRLDDQATRSEACGVCAALHCRARDHRVRCAAIDGLRAAPGSSWWTCDRGRGEDDGDGRHALAEPRKQRSGAGDVATRYSVGMPQDKVAFAERVVEIFNRRDVDTFFAELATPDFEWWPALTRGYEGGCFRGREGVEGFYADTDENWEEFHSVAEEFRDLSDYVVVMSRLTGRGRSSGARVDAPIWNILDFRNSRVWRTRAYFDRADAFRAAGVSE